MSNYKERHFTELWYCEDGDFTVHTVDGSEDEYALTFNGGCPDEEVIAYLQQDLVNHPGDADDIKHAIELVRSGYLVEYDED